MVIVDSRPWRAKVLADGTLGLKPDTKVTAIITVSDEKCRRKAFSAERIVGKRYLVVSHSGTKEWDGKEALCSTAEQI